MAPHSSTLAWKIPWTEEPGRLQSMGCYESDTSERLHFHFSLSCIGEGNGNPLQCSCLENPRDGGSLVGGRLWGHTELDTTESTQQQQQQQQQQTFSNSTYIHTLSKVNQSFCLNNIFITIKYKKNNTSFYIFQSSQKKHKTKTNIQLKIQ